MNARHYRRRIFVGIERLTSVTDRLRNFLVGQKPSVVGRRNRSDNRISLTVFADISEEASGSSGLKLSISGVIQIRLSGKCRTVGSGRFVAIRVPRVVWSPIVKLLVKRHPFAVSGSPKPRGRVARDWEPKQMVLAEAHQAIANRAIASA